MHRYYLLPFDFTMSAFLTETEKAVVDVGVTPAPVIIIVRAKQSLTVCVCTLSSREAERNE